jgi:hypothetical protein
MLIGGQFNLAHNTYSNLDTLYKYNYNSTEYQIVPGFGYFIKDNFAVGAEINLDISNTTYKNSNSYNTPVESTTKSNTIGYGEGIFARYYKRIAGNFFFFAEGKIGYTYRIQKLDYSTSDSNYVYPANFPAHQEVQLNKISIDVKPGLVYFISPKLGIQTVFGDIDYSNSNSKNISLQQDNHNNSKSYGINLNMSTFYLGLSYYF